MADEQLRLVASVTDGFTSPLRKLKTELASVKAPPVIKEMQTGLAALKTQMNSVGAEMRAGFGSIASSFGVGSIGVAGALGAIAFGMKNFAGQTQALRIMGKEIGLTSDRIRALSEMGQRFGVSSEAMQGGLRQFAGVMEQVKDKWGDAYGQLRDMNLGKLAEDLASAPNMSAAVDRLFAGLANVPDPVKRRRVLSMLGLPEEWSGIIGEVGRDFSKAVDEIQRHQGRIGKDAEDAADKFEGGMSRARQSLDRLKVEGFTPLLAEANRAFDYLNEPSVLASFSETIKSATGDLKDMIAGFKLLNDGNVAGAARKITGANGPLARQLAPQAGDDVIAAKEKVAELERRIARADSLKGGMLDAMGADNAGLADRLREDLKAARAELETAKAKQVHEEKLRAALEKHAEELRKTRESGGALKQDMSFGGTGTGLGGLIHKAAFGASGGFPSVIPPDVRDGPVVGGGGSRRSRADASSSDGGPGIEGATAPRGSGRGTKGSARMADMMGWAMDQLRREGVPEKHLRQSAAHLVGQAQMESGLDPNKSHDGGTGYGIYGARDPKGWGDPNGRRTKMVKWLEANGYARNSAEGQMRYMAIEAMRSKAYGATRNILMGRGSGDLERDTNAITENFEAPKITNRRSGAVRDAFRVGPSAMPSDPPTDWGSREGRRPGPGQGMGDAMMGKAFGPGGVGGVPAAPPAKGSVHIQLAPGMQDARANVKYDGMFKEVTVGRGSQVA